MISLALVDDHTMMRKAMVASFKNDKYTVVFDAGNGQEMIDKINEGSVPDLVVMDISMPVMNGYESTKWLSQNYPKVKVLALSMYNDEIPIIRMLRSGAKGYITKDSHPDEMERAINEIIERGYYHSELISDTIKHMVNSSDKTSLVSIVENLTENELTYLRLACTDLSNKQMADEMKTSESNVNFFRHSLCTKFNTSTRIGLIVFAIKNNLVTI